MPEYHVRRREKVGDVFVVKDAMNSTNSLGDFQDLDLIKHSEDENLDEIGQVIKVMMTTAEKNVSEDVKTTAVKDNFAVGRIKQVPSEVPALAKIKNIFYRLAIYLAGFWIVRMSLTLAHNSVALMEIIAQIIDAPIAELFSSMRRIIQSLLDYQVGSTLGEVFAEELMEVKEIEEADLNFEAMEFLPKEELRKSSNLVFEEMEPNQMKSYEKRLEKIDELDESNNICTDILEECSEYIHEECSEDIQDEGSDDILVECSDDILEECSDDILEECSDDIQDSFIQFEEIATVEEFSSSSDEEVLFCNVGTDDSEMEEEPFKKVTLKIEEKYDIINADNSKSITLENSCVENVDGFIGSPASVPATAHGHPRFQHLNGWDMYQKRYNNMTWRSVSSTIVKQDMVGPIQNILEDLIEMVPQGSSSGATSRKPILPTSRKPIVPDKPQHLSAANKTRPHTLIG